MLDFCSIILVCGFLLRAYKMAAEPPSMIFHSRQNGCGERSAKGMCQMLCLFFKKITNQFIFLETPTEKTIYKLLARTVSLVPLVPREPEKSSFYRHILFYYTCRWCIFYQVKFYGNPDLSDDGEHSLAINYF